MKHSQPSPRRSWLVASRRWRWWRERKRRATTERPLAHGWRRPTRSFSTSRSFCYQASDHLFAETYERGGGAGEPLEYAIDSSVALGWATTARLPSSACGNAAFEAHLVVGGRGRRLRGPGHRAKFKAFGAFHTPLAVDVGEKVSLVTVDLAPRGAGQRPPHPGALHAARCAPARAPRGSRGTGGRPPAADCRNGGGRGALCVGSRGGAVALHADPQAGEQLARIIRDDRRPGIVVDVPLSWRSGIDQVGSPFISPRAMVSRRSTASRSRRDISRGSTGRCSAGSPPGRSTDPCSSDRVTVTSHSAWARGTTQSRCHCRCTPAEQPGSWSGRSHSRRILHFEGIGYHRRAEDDGAFLL